MAKSRARQRARACGGPLLVLGGVGAAWCFASPARLSASYKGSRGLTLRPRQHSPARCPSWRGLRWRTGSAASGDVRQVGPDRQAWSVWAKAALEFAANLVVATLVGAPYTYVGETRQHKGPRWLWSFWVRLPPVLCAGYLAFPALCRAAARHFPASASLNQVIVNLFAPIVSLIYAIIAGQVVVSLWSRLFSIRMLLNRELAALEILERKLPEDDSVAKRLFSEHVVGLDKYAIQQGTIAPNYYNKLAELAALPSLKDDTAVQELLDSLADLRAERRANTEIGYPRTLWGTLRVCSIILLGCFVILAQGFGTKSAIEQRGIRIIFCLFILTVFWVNHLCRDMAELNYGEFQIDASVLRTHTALGGMRRRASELLHEP